ncbi:uncharacterized protein [Lolium perenne]|uniref:uncharacterized protein isoform X2 n=1 Tax=Lolium perenne TaxID=4522 RepID=UPI0021F66F7F|nr:uncharacterized protein LOC127331841 isoform X2 [Lolium perenne]
MERFGNALGTLAFTWATVVLLGGYPTVLRPDRDFLFAAIIIFLEALRMFSRNNRLDYQLFFRTRGAFRSLGSNGLIVFACFSNGIVWMIIQDSDTSFVLFGLLWIGLFLSPYARLLICSPLRDAMSLWSPMVAILLLCPSILHTLDEDFNVHKLSFKNSIAKRILYMVLFVVVLLLTISRLQFPSIIKIVDRFLGSKIVFWRQVILNMSMFATIGMLVSTFDGSAKFTMLIIDVMVLMIVSLGNFQIPAAVLRITLAAYGIHKAKDQYSDHAYKGDLGENTNLMSSLYIFYAMVVGQGILYIIASILEIFSFILRRSLVGNAGFRGTLGVECVNLYYEDAFEKCMNGTVLAPEKTSLVRFAMDSLKSDSPKKQLYGLKMLHNFLKKEQLKTKAISELTTCMKTMTCLINMLGWTSEGHKDIRSFAAKVTAEIADSLSVIHVPREMQLIASLLETNVRKIKDPLLDICSPKRLQDSNPIQQISRSELTSPMLKWLKQMAVYCLIPREDPTNMDEQKPRILRCWKRSFLEEEPSTDTDILPVVGMLILNKLARFDLESCTEIYRATGLISKIIEFTTKRTDIANINETHQALLKGSSLKLLRSLSSTEGKLGVALRQQILEHPFILSNLAEILDDNGSSQELRELTAELLRNLARDGNREEISHIRVIISRLMHAFLSQSAPSSKDSDHLLRMIAGQALAVLAIESANNCLAMLAEPGYAFIKELTVMIQGDRYRYIASSLLRNMCLHARAKFGKSDLKEVSYILREVMEGIMDVEGTELEILVGLSSQICKVIPEDFARELEHGQIKERFTERLVNALNSNMIPAAHCPGIRRAIIEHAISMVLCG